MLLASSRQKPIHGAVTLSGKLSPARRKGSDLTLIELSGALEGYRLKAPRRSRTRRRPRPRSEWLGGVDFVERRQTIVPKGISKVVPEGRNDGSLA
jgi:hypothetical protein